MICNEAQKSDIYERLCLLPIWRHLCTTPASLFRSSWHRGGVLVLVGAMENISWRLSCAWKLVNKKLFFLSSLSPAESQPRIICCDAPSDLCRNLDRLPSMLSPQVQVHQGLPQWVQHSSHPKAVSPSHGNAINRCTGTAAGKGRGQGWRVTAAEQEQGHGDWVYSHTARPAWTQVGDSTQLLSCPHLPLRLPVALS